MNTPQRVVKVRHSHLVPEGKACCTLDGRPVWYGALQEVRDLRCFNELLLHAADLEELRRRLTEAEASGVHVLPVVEFAA